MEMGDYMCTVDIKDTYHGISIHLDNRERQYLHYYFTGSMCTYLKDNRRCKGLFSSPYVFSEISDFVVRCATRE